MITSKEGHNLSEQKGKWKLPGLLVILQICHFLLFLKNTYYLDIFGKNEKSKITKMYKVQSSSSSYACSSDTGFFSPRHSLLKASFVPSKVFYAHNHFHPYLVSPPLLLLLLSLTLLPFLPSSQIEAFYIHFLPFFSI